MHKPESVLESEMYKILWNFKIQMNHFIPGRRPEIVLIDKKKELAILWILLFWQTTEWK